MPQRFPFPPRGGRPVDLGRSRANASVPGMEQSGARSDRVWEDALAPMRRVLVGLVLSAVLWSLAAFLVTRL